MGYIRVSTQHQEDIGQSLDGQTAKIRNYAAEKDFRLVGIYEEVASAMPGKSGARPVLQDLIAAAKSQGAVIIVTDVDRLSRSYKEVKAQIITPGIPVHVVSLNRMVGRNTLLKLARQAEAAGAKKSQDTKTAFQGKKARGSLLGATQKTLRHATDTNIRNRSANAWKTVIDIAIFICADPIRRTWTRRELVAALNDAKIKTTRGNAWTIESLTRPLRKAKLHINLQDEPDENPVGFDHVLLVGQDW